jgi:hypothetical protein
MRSSAQSPDRHFKYGWGDGHHRRVRGLLTHETRQLLLEHAGILFVGGTILRITNAATFA